MSATNHKASIKYLQRGDHRQKMCDVVHRHYGLTQEEMEQQLKAMERESRAAA